MLYYFKKGKNSTEMLEKISAVYGEGAVTGQTCQKWFLKFHARDFSLDNISWSGKPVEVDSNQIINWEQSILYHAGDSWHTHSIQIKSWKSFAQTWLYY